MGHRQHGATVLRLARRLDGLDLDADLDALVEDTRIAAIRRTR